MDMWVTARSTETRRFVQLTENNMIDVLRVIPNSSIRWGDDGELIAVVMGCQVYPGDWLDTRGNIVPDPHDWDMWEAL